jgi:diguanylate cyclase (GGDEF)-like protein
MKIEKELNNLIRLTSNVFDAFTAALFLVDESRSKLILKACHSLSRNIIKDAVIEFGHGLVGWVAQQGDNLSVAQFRHDTKTLQFYSADEEIKSFLAVPVFLSGLEGVLCIDSKKSYVFTPKMQKILIGFAEQFSLLISRSRIEELSDKNIQDVTMIYEYIKEMSSLDQAEKIIDCLAHISSQIISSDGFFISFFDKNEAECRVVRSSSAMEEGFQGMTVSIKNSLAGWIIRNKNPLNTPNLSQDSNKTYFCSPQEPVIHARSFLGVPLQTGNKVHGVLGLIRRKEGGFSLHDMQKAQIIASYASLAFAHAHLNEKWSRLEFTDSLSGFYNKRFFEENIENILFTASKRLDKLVFLLVRVNHIEKIKERYGYGAGDAVLRKIAEILNGFLKEKDAAIKHDEASFLLLLHKLDVEKANRVSERVESIVDQTIFIHEDKELHTTVSTGISVYPTDGSSKKELLEKAEILAIGARKGKSSKSLSDTKTAISR